MKSKPREACGVFGIYTFDDERIAPSLYWGMISQNHRGHQSYGALTFNGDFEIETGLGLLPVSERQAENHFKGLPGSVGIGHVRYATSGVGDPSEDVQPYVDENGDTKVAIGYNGNLVNNRELRKELREKFGEFSTSSDTELLCKKLLEGLREGDLSSAVRLCMEDIEGSFSVVGVDQSGRLFAFRDPYGIKPLCYGKSMDGRTYGISSESVGLSINGLDYIGEVKPGELLICSEDGLNREQIVESNGKSFCAFEYAYFARPDSILNGKTVYKIREEFGKNLAREDPDVTEKVDMVVSIPKTADDAAYGFHLETGLPWERALRKHRYITSRAFISPAEKRGEIINKKINIDWPEIEGKNIAVVEDSIVRGSTSRRTVKKMKEGGVEDIHLYVTFPRIIAPCFYGIDMATYEELIGADHTPEEIADEIGVESVNYQSIENFIKTTGLRVDEICKGCFTRDYPTPMAQKLADKSESEFRKGKNDSGRIYERDLS